MLFPNKIPAFSDLGGNGCSFVDSADKKATWSVVYWANFSNVSASMGSLPGLWFKDETW